jgi:lysozyme
MSMNPKVIDLYHDDREHDFAQVFSSGIRGVIHKATQGSGDVDPTFRSREIAARAVGLMWGWYHYLDGTDLGRQAEHFYTTIGSSIRGPGILVLDFEEPQVPLNAGLRWLELIEQLSGQTPWIYIGGGVPGTRMTAFARYPLWLPEYGSVAHVPQPWEKYTLWQFTAAGTVPGVTGSVDLSHFDGTDDELRSVWLGAAAATADTGGPPDPWEAQEEENHAPGIREGDDSVRIDSVADVSGHALPPDDGTANGDFE